MKGKRVWIRPKASAMLLPKLLKKFLAPKRIPTRGPVKVRDNPQKRRYIKPRSKSQAQCIAEYRDEQLRYYSPAVEALESALRGLGIHYRREEPIIVDYKRFFLVDVWCMNIKVGFEADGQGHRMQNVYDRDRDTIIQAKTGFGISRQFNGWYLKPALKDRILVELSKCQ